MRVMKFISVAVALTMWFTIAIALQAARLRMLRPERLGPHSLHHENYERLNRFQSQEVSRGAV